MPRPDRFTYAELIEKRTELCDTLRNAPIHQHNTEWQRDMVREIAHINKLLARVENLNPVIRL